MNILVYGAGGVGGYFGGRLAKAGHEVNFIARGEHLEAIQKNGVEIESLDESFIIHPKKASETIKGIEKPDLVILGVKSWQLPKIGDELKSIISDDTMVLPLQNGADNYEKLVEVLPKKNVLAGLCFIVSYIEKPGKIKHAAFEPRITFGEADNSKTQRIQKLASIFSEAGISHLNPENIQLEIWKKFLFICTISGIGGLTRVSIDKIRKSEFLYDLMRKTASEIKAIANAKAIPISEEHIEKVFKTIQSQPIGTTASTQRDIMQGKPSELENFNGFIVKEGKRLGIQTPANLFIYECLKPMEAEARKRPE